MAMANMKKTQTLQNQVVLALFILLDEEHTSQNLELCREDMSNPLYWIEDNQVEHMKKAQSIAANDCVDLKEFHWATRN